MKSSKAKVFKVSREVARTIVKNHNCISREMVEKYTDSELKEVLKQLNMNADF